METHQNTLYKHNLNSNEFVMLGPLLLEKSACRDIKHWSTAHKQKINQRKRMNFKKHRHTCTFEWTKLNEKMAFKSYA